VRGDGAVGGGFGFVFWGVGFLESEVGVSRNTKGIVKFTYTLPQMPALVASTRMLGPIRRGPKAVIFSMTSAQISF
jgi:hypothetical protein